MNSSTHDYELDQTSQPRLIFMSQTLIMKRVACLAILVIALVLAVTARLTAFLASPNLAWGALAYPLWL